MLVTVCAGLGVAALLLALTHSARMAMLAPFGVAGFAVFLVRHRIAKRKRAFEAQLPNALSLIASSLYAGHTFLRAIQMMCEESNPPMAEEFTRVVAETQLGDSLVNCLERMAQRIQVRDMDMVVQAVRIQQTVGGRLADLLHTLASKFAGRSTC
jgi:tight adherence protein B